MSPQVLALPRLSTKPQVQNVTTSTIGIEWKKDYDGDGPVCGFIVELKAPDSTSWTSVGFVSFDDDQDDFEYTIDRLDAGALYGISVIILHCSNREGETGPEISRSTEDYLKNVTTSTIGIEWKGAYDGDGPVCGFIVELKPPDSTLWMSVAFVSFEEKEADFEYIIDRLNAGALYGISIIILHCSGREGERGPDISQSTEDYVLPSLSHRPNATAIGTSYVVFRWQDQHAGDGPICAYAIDRRSFSDDIPSWLAVGFVSAQPGSLPREELTFNVTGLEPDTDYKVSVRPVLCDGARTSELGEGPILSLTTPSIVLPTLVEAPQSTNLSSNNVTIRWTNQHQGDGPICGYGINIKTNDDKERGGDDDSDPWGSVGYVSVESELQFDVGHLEPNTTYQVAVSVINCISSREGPREPILQFTTTTVTIPVVVLPTLVEAPQSTNLSSNNVTIRWTNQHQGDGPICGYGINIKTNDDKDRGGDDDSDPWGSVGYVSVESEPQFDVGHLEPNTTYQVAVSVINCISSREGPREPILQFTTKTVTIPVVVLPSLSHRPNATAIGTSYVVFWWQDQHTGDGPICAYAIDRRSFSDDIPSWLAVGFVSAQPGSLSREELTFNVTGL
ncbi:cell adhesion molecule-related/down-regulated by oncogenes-like [Strongylocentrotus purpuratus]|uniref:Fibronectin type-III domain-containing protein n=1 Tax=Strongylocentrotus purpuratus TaxID=7668 RepID=A0A7M7PG35_STRPU|nr:cell adhesion molecule-related/down-regulated by oncogenes-like [Strongylocentrotus purpuratus]